MAKIITFTLSILFYLIGMAGLFMLILWMGNLLPFLPFETTPNMSGPSAIAKNFSLILLFGLQHSIMARQSFKRWWTAIIGKHIERSVYVLISGLLCVLIVWQWEPLNGSIWHFSSGEACYYVMYALYFLGIAVLLSSSFIINHFELFGLQQGYYQLKNRHMPDHRFQVKLFYKIVRHPIYLGFFLIVWATPHMSMTHALLSIGFTCYIYIGIYFEERDLKTRFGTNYLDYMKRVPKLIPFIKINKKKSASVKHSISHRKPVEN